MKANKGITLIALVITIIVLIILGGVSIASILSDDGIINKSKKASEEYQKEAMLEKIQLIVVGSFDEKGKLNAQILKTNIENKIENAVVTLDTASEDEFPIVVKVDGYGYEITSNGTVTETETDGISIKTTITITEEEQLEINTQVTSKEDTILKISIMKNETEEVANVSPNSLSGSVSYLGTKEDTYLVKVKTTKTEKESQIDTYIPIAPVIAQNYGYSIITKYGIESGDKIDIVYDTNSQIKNYYSLDGTNWTEYTEKFEMAELGTVYAKSVNTNNNLETITSKEITEKPTDNLSDDAYDDDVTSYVTISSGSKKISVDENMWGESVLLTAYFKHAYDSSYRQYIKFYDNQGNTTTYKEFTSNGDGSTTYTDEEIIITEGTLYIIFESGSRTDYVSQIKEIRVKTDPVLNVGNKYPTITQTGIENPCSYVTIDYHETSVQKLYRINEGDWQNYKGERLKLELGDVLEAKGINKNNIETYVVSTTPEMDDMLIDDAYDNDVTSYVTINKGSKKIAVDESLWGKPILLTAYFKHAGTASYCQYIKFYDNQGNTTTYKEFSSNGTASTTYTDEEIIIPEGTLYIIFESGGNTDYVSQIKEIRVKTDPVLNVENKYPTITQTGIEDPCSYVTIDYHETSVQKLYRINGGDWQNYKGERLKLELGDVLEAKGINKNNIETYVVSTTPEMDDMLIDDAYDNDVTSYVTINKGSKKIAVDENIWGKPILLTAYFKHAGTASYCQYIKFYDNQGNTTTYKEFSSNGDGSTTYTDEEIIIPEETMYIIFESGGNTNYVSQIKEIKFAQ